MLKTDSRNAIGIIIRNFILLIFKEFGCLHFSLINQKKNHKFAGSKQNDINHQQQII